MMEYDKTKWNKIGRNENEWNKREKKEMRCDRA